MIGLAHAIRIEALRLLGEFLKMPGAKAKGTTGQFRGRDISGGTVLVPPENTIPTLTDIGLDKKTSAIAQKLAGLPHGEFINMCDSDLPFRRTTAFRLMAVTNDVRLSNVAHGQHLPSSWRTLYELTKLDDGTWQYALDAGIADKAQQLQAYAKQRHDPELESWVSEIKLRAIRRIGELSGELETLANQYALASGGKSKTEALKAAGLSTSVAHRCEKIAGIGPAFISRTDKVH